MRRFPAVLAVLGLSAVALVACSTSDDPAASCPRPAEVGEAASLVELSDAGSLENVSVTAPVYTDEVSYHDVVRGDGEPLVSATQGISFDTAVYNGETGEETANTGYNQEAAPLVTLSTFSGLPPAIFDALECATAGSRVVVVLPADEVPADLQPGLGLTETSSAIFVFDIYDVYPARATGADQFNDRQGMPSVVLAPDGRPGVIVPDVDPPTELVTEVLKKGDGETVAAEDTVVVQYTGLSWSDKTVFDSSWESGAPIALSLTQIIPGFVEGLEGQTVGSQVLLVIPPDLGYGASGSGAIGPNETLVFVVDILGIRDTSSATG